MTPARSPTLTSARSTTGSRCSDLAPPLGDQHVSGIDPQRDPRTKFVVIGSRAHDVSFQRGALDGDFESCHRPQETAMDDNTRSVRLALNLDVLRAKQGVKDVVEIGRIASANH